MSDYNLTQLRILWEFSSDGLIFNNFIAHSAPASGDFSITNIKSDILEQKFRTDEVSGAFFILDAGATYDPVLSPQRAIFVDTIGILETNISPYATIDVYAYGDQSSNAVRNTYVGSDSSALDDFITAAEYHITIPAPSDPYEKNILWAANTQPINPYRHWCVVINDHKNTDEFIEVGRFVAGQASILTELENYTSDVKYSENNYKDEMEINGFSAISNNRALKKKISLTFDKINVNGDNYRTLRKMLRYVRDTKKSLILPDPINIYLFNLFAKLEKLPEQSIKYIQNDVIHATFTLDFNEGK